MIKFLPLLLLLCFSCQSAKEEPLGKYKALIIDGSNNHYVWPKTTQMMKSYLEETGLFNVSIQRMDTVWLGEKYNPNRPMPYKGYFAAHPVANADQVVVKRPLQKIEFNADFGSFDLVLLNVGNETPRWRAATETAFEDYMKNGGGLMVVHAANNAWGDWPAFNEMIGLGGWGGRDSTNGPAVYLDQELILQKNNADDVCATHGPESEYLVTTRAGDHPIMKGLPTTWLHAQDELYARMRGPFKNAVILATAYSDPILQTVPWDTTITGTGRHEPMLLTIEYGKGRVFHSAMGHFDYSQECVGFITTFQRGAEWVVSGKVSQVIPEDFPSSIEVSNRTWTK